VKNIDFWKIKSYSGVRGVYGSELTPEATYYLANAYASIMETDNVIIGRDTRPSGIPLKHATISGLTTAGCKVIDVDIAPTPAILYFTKRLKMDGGIIISASHNPPEYNAMKMSDGNGLLIWDDKLDEIIKRAEGGELKISNNPGTIECRDINDGYIEAVMKVMDVEDVKNSNLKVVVDPGGGAGSLTTPKMLSKLGCKVISINAIPGKFSRPIEPTEEALKETSKIVKSIGADIGLAHDCDADRLVCIDDTGKVVGEDYSMAIALRHIIKRKKVNRVVINVASSKVLQDIAEEYGVKVYWSKVGEANMIKTMMETNSEIGVEGSSGGLILKEFHMARDGAIATLAIIREVMESGKKVSEIISEMPRYYMIKTNIQKNNINLEDKIDKLKVLGDLNLIDGVKISSENWWALIRPSRTEPKIRIIVEAREREQALETIKRVLEIISC